MTQYLHDTIAAVATPPGCGGVGIIRVSGPEVSALAKQCLGFLPKPRLATFTTFRGTDNQEIDNGVALFFPGPNSFTGEDVLELQGHGGPVILDNLLAYLLSMGVRTARPGEFSLRAFLNNKIDLAQAEAIADLIHASSMEAAHCAFQSLQGVFSNEINRLILKLIDVRKITEALIDFPDEDLEPSLSEYNIKASLTNILELIHNIFIHAQHGVLLQEGVTIVIAGPPNAGKSSLLNYLAGQDRAIVTEVAGTTRDVLREYIHIDGLPLHIIDTAGLRKTKNIIEQEGIRRTHQEIKKANMLLFVVDATETKLNSVEAMRDLVSKETLDNLPCVILENKIDLTPETPKILISKEIPSIHVSIKKNQGLDLLKKHIQEKFGYNKSESGIYMARRRHLDALNRAEKHLQNALSQLEPVVIELFAEELRLAQLVLGEITGEFTSDDLLGEIFSTFCIGK